MAVIVGNYRNCIYFKMWVRILPHGTIITQAIKGFVSSSKPQGEYWWVLPLAPFIPFLYFLPVLSVCTFLPFWHDLNVIPILLLLNSLVYAYSKKHFMHSEAWSLFFFYVMSSLLFIYHIFKFSSYFINKFSSY